jgi:hypothetical protein
VDEDEDEDEDEVVEATGDADEGIVAPPSSPR